jgi:ubiquinone/menaquinone biosynthesis C-methylase UbiE
MTIRGRYPSGVKRATDLPELLDGPLDPVTLAGNLRDLTRVNRWLGGTALSRKALLALTRGHPGPTEMLDVGTGAADIPDALIGWLARRRRELVVTAVDTRREILDAARLRIAAVPEVLRLELVDSDRLPYPDRSFDIAHCSLVLHHAEPADAQRLLGEMARVSRLGVIVNDLDRSRRFWFAAWLLSRVTTRNPYTRHDAPRSVRRAYRSAEVAQMATRAGLVESARFHDPLRHRYAICFVRARAAGTG